MSLQSTAMEKWNELINEPTPLQVYVALAVLFVTTMLLLLYLFLRRAKSNTIVLAGLSGGGKTVIFYQLQDGSSHQGTVTSMDPNEGTFILHSEIVKKGKIKPVHIVDVPGHAQLRPKLDEFLPNAAGVVFVIDALNFLPNIQASVEDKLRASRKTVSAADITNEFTLGLMGQQFTFSHCHNKVTVTDASGITGEISQIEQFIREYVTLK